jgi:multiple antibiotic resistance protein
METFLQLLILFFVIIDPLASFSVYVAATKKLEEKERFRIATLAIAVASGIGLAVLLLGEGLLIFLNTDIDHFRIAGGIILGLLGLKMAMGYSLADTTEKGSSGIAAIIATPLITGPATITAIIIAVSDFGMAKTAGAFFTVVAATAVLFLFAHHAMRWVSESFVQVLTTILGLITIAWGVNFIITGLRAIFGF